MTEQRRKKISAFLACAYSGYRHRWYPTQSLKTRAICSGQIDIRNEESLSWESGT